MRKKERKIEKRVGVSLSRGRVREGIALSSRLLDEENEVTVKTIGLSFFLLLSHLYLLLSFIHLLLSFIARLVYRFTKRRCCDDRSVALDR